MRSIVRLDISKSVTKEEWAQVYKEVLQLVQHFPFAECQKVKIHDCDINCLVPVKEHSGICKHGAEDAAEQVGLFIDGDYISRTSAGRFFLPRDLIKEEEINPNAGDAMMGRCSVCLWDGDHSENTYIVWHADTQETTYQSYLLAVACLIEARLGEKAFSYGDMTYDQYRTSVRIANQYLDKAIEMPDRCYKNRFWNRVSKLPLSEEDKIATFEEFYSDIADDEVTADDIREAFFDMFAKEFKFDIVKYERLKYYKKENT